MFRLSKLLGQIFPSDEQKRRNLIVGEAFAHGKGCSPKVCALYDSDFI
jgi:hypothetical protein